MPNEPNDTQGASGAPSAGAAADGSGGASGLDLQSLLTAPDPPPQGAAPPPDEFKDLPWDKFHAAWRAGKIPENIKKEQELPFLQEFTRKNQAFAKEKEALLTSFIDRLSAHGMAPTPEQKDELHEKLKASGIPVELIDEYLEKRTRPIVSDLNSNRMEQLAMAAHPLVKERKEEIAEIIRTSPAAARLILANGGRDGHEVIAGIARQLENDQLKQEIKALKDGLPEMRVRIAKEIIAELRKTGQVLPPTTSRAGSGPTATAGAGAYEDFRSAAIAAARELNLPH